MAFPNSQRQREGEHLERQQSELLRRRGKISERGPPQAITESEVNQSKHRVDKDLVFVVAEKNQAVGLVDFHREPDAEREQRQDVLRLGFQQPRQRNDANEPEQDGVGWARDEMINLADERDVGEEETRPDEMQRLAAHFAQP